MMRRKNTAEAFEVLLRIAREQGKTQAVESKGGAPGPVATPGGKDAADGPRSAFSGAASVSDPVRPAERTKPPALAPVRPRREPLLKPRGGLGRRWSAGLLGRSELLKAPPQAAGEGLKPRAPQRPSALPRWLSSKPQSDRPSESSKDAPPPEAAPLEAEEAMPSGKVVPSQEAVPAEESSPFQETAFPPTPCEEDIEPATLRESVGDEVADFSRRALLPARRADTPLQKRAQRQRELALAAREREALLSGAEATKRDVLAESEEDRSSSGTEPVAPDPLPIQCLEAKDTPSGYYRIGSDVETREAFRGESSRAEGSGTGGSSGGSGPPAKKAGRRERRETSSEGGGSSSGKVGGTPSVPVPASEPVESSVTASQDGKERSTARSASEILSGLPQKFLGWVLGPTGGSFLERRLELRLSTLLVFGMAGVITVLLLVIYLSLPGKEDPRFARIEDSRAEQGHGEGVPAEPAQAGGAAGGAAAGNPAPATLRKPLLLWSPGSDPGGSPPEGQVVTPDVRNVEASRQDGSSGTGNGAGSPSVPAVPTDLFMIQVRSNEDREGADGILEYLRGFGFEENSVEPHPYGAKGPEGQPLYTVYVGRFSDKKKADQELDRLKKETRMKPYKDKPDFFGRSLVLQRLRRYKDSDS